MVILCYFDGRMMSGFLFSGFHHNLSCSNSASLLLTYVYLSILIRRIGIFLHDFFVEILAVVSICRQDGSPSFIATALLWLVIMFPARFDCIRYSGSHFFADYIYTYAHE